jgi:rRNA-processing protein FCF1
LDGPVVLVLEGKAKAGVAEHAARDGVAVVHAAGSGDDTIADLAGEHGQDAVVVTADRALAARVRACGARVEGPSSLLARLPD